jgi:hypothetical protein
MVNYNQKVLEKIVYFHVFYSTDAFKEKRMYTQQIVGSLSMCLNRRSNFIRNNKYEKLHELRRLFLSQIER